MLLLARDDRPLGAPLEISSLRLGDRVVAVLRFADGRREVVPSGVAFTSSGLLEVDTDGFVTRSSLSDWGRVDPDSFPTDTWVSASYTHQGGVLTDCVRF